MRVLVTGANGFVGSHLSRLLAERGAEVRALVRKGSDARLLDGVAAERVEGDVRDPASLARAIDGCEQVYHTAALVRFFAPDPAPMWATNVDGTRNLLRAARKAGVKRFVHTSTVAVLRRFDDGTLADETMAADPDEAIGPYEETKIEAERIVLDACRDGLPAVIVNPAGPVGPGDLKPSPIGRVVIEFLRRRIPAYSETGVNLVDVRDVALGHILAAEKGLPAERYILAGENLSLKGFFDLLAELSGAPAPRVKVSYALTLVGGLLGEIRGRLTGEEPLACLASVRMGRRPHHFTAAKAQRDLGFRPRPVKQALADEIAWFRARGMA